MWNFKRQLYATYNIPIIACSAGASSGGTGVAEYAIPLEKPLGGIVIIDFDAVAVSDKLEIIHNGIKKATSGMTVSNEGPFDNLYGDPTVPTIIEANTIDQFIGTDKGTIPTRDSDFLTDTGITDIIRTKQQLVWFVYTSTDYGISDSVIIRVVGPTPSTGWFLTRLCTDQDPIGL